MGKVKKRESRPEELRDFVEKLASYTIGTSAERKYILTREYGDHPEQFFRLFVEGLELRTEPQRMTAQKKAEVVASAKEMLERFRRIPASVEKDEQENAKEMGRLEKDHAKNLENTERLTRIISSKEKAYQHKKMPSTTLCFPTTMGPPQLPEADASCGPT